MRLVAINATLAALCFSTCAFAQNHDADDPLLADASEKTAQIQAVVDDIANQLADARGKQDIARMDCLNGLLVSAKAFLSVAKNGESNLKDACARNDDAAKQHHFKLLGLALSKTREVHEKVSECGFGNSNPTGETRATATRVCKIEPCLEGEWLTDPAAIDTVSAATDASPYL